MHYEGIYEDHAYARRQVERLCKKASRVRRWPRWWSDYRLPKLYDQIDYWQGEMHSLSHGML